MKNVITYLKTLWGAWGNLLSNDVICDRRLTRGVLCFLGKLARRIYSFGCSQDILGAPQSLHSSPSGLDAKTEQKGNMEQKGEMSTSCLLLNSYLPLTCPLFASLSLVSRQSDLDTYAAGKTNNASGARVAQEWMKYAAILLVLTLGVGNVWGAEATLEITSGVTSNTTLTDDQGITWAVTSDGTYTSNSSYIQCGTNKSAVSYIQLVSTGLSAATISKVQVWGTSKASTSVTASVSIGGNSLGSSSAYTVQNAASGGTEYSVNNSSNYTGEVTIRISRPSSANGAIYFNKLIVTYTTGGGGGCSECTYYVYNGSTWVSIGTTEFDDVVLAPPTLDDNGHGAGNGCWVKTKDFFDGKSCQYTPNNTNNDYRFVPNPGGAAPDDNNKPGTGTCELYAVYYDDYGCLSTTVTAVQCVRIWEEPVNLAVSSVSSTGATLSWDAIDGVSSYHVIVTKVSNSSIVFDGNVNGTSKSLTGLTSGTEYSWKVAANSTTNDACDSNFSKGDNFTTCASGFTSLTPTVTADNTGKNGGEALFELSGATSYSVTLKNNSTNAVIAGYNNVSNTSGDITFSGLTASTTYRVEVIAHNACGDNSQTGSDTFTTDAATLYTVTFHNAAGSAPGAVTQTTEGGTVSIPNTTACEGWAFVGWKIGSAQSSTTSDPTGSGTWITSASWPKSYTPTGNIDAYAVFKQTVGGGSGAAANTVLWSEDFSGYSASDVPDETFSSSDSHTGTTVYSGSVTYACIDGGTATSVKAEYLAGGTSPELLVGKKDGTSIGHFTVTDIPKGGATAVTVTFYTNNKTFNVDVSGTGYTSDGYHAKGSGSHSFDITCGSASTFSLDFYTSTGDNVRLDNIDVKVKTAGASGTTTWTSSPDCGSTKELTSITIDTDPTRLNYVTGEFFDPTGAVVTAHYDDLSTETVTGSTSWVPETALTEGTGKTATASYTEGGVTKTATVTYNVYTPTLAKKDETGTTISGLLSDAPAISCSAATVTAAANGNQYVFKEWQISGGTFSGGVTTTSTNPATITSVSGAVTVTAVYWKPIEVKWYVNGSQYGSTGIYNYGWSVQYPTPPTPASVNCEGKVFIGWSRTSSYRSDTRPTDFVESGESLTSNENFYAIFADKLSDGTPPTWTKTSLGSVSAGIYLICMSTGSVFNGTISSGNGQITSSVFETSLTSNTTIVEDAPEGACEVTFAQVDANHFTMQVAGKGYLYASGTTTGHLAYQNSESNYWFYDHDYWRYSGQNTSGTYVALYDYSHTTFKNSTNTSSVNQIILLKKTDAGVPATYADYTTTCTCSEYQFHYQHSSSWNAENICFSPVAGATNNYLTEEMALPYAEWYKVTWQGNDQSYTAVKGFAGTTDNIPMPFYHNRGKSFGVAPQNGNIGGGKGRFHVYHDSGSTNKYVSFVPTGYTLNFGTGDTWTNDLTLNFTGKTSNWDETEWYTDIVTLTNAQIGKKIFVGLQTETGYVWCDPYSQKDNLSGLRTKSGSGESWVSGGMSTSYPNKTGKFRIYANSGDKNWYVTFVPYYHLVYDANGGSGAPAASEYVSCEETAANRTIAISATEPTRANYRFMGWATSTERAAAGTVDYKYGTANNSIVLTSEQTLYAVWKQVYTVTYNYAGGTGTCSNGEYIEGESVTVCASTPTKAASEFDGWSYSPSVTVTAGAFTMPASDVTITATWREASFVLTQTVGSHTTKGHTGTAISSSMTNAPGMSLTYTIEDIPANDDYALPKTITISGGGQTWVHGTNYTWTLEDDKHSATLHIGNNLTISADVTVTITEQTRYTVIWDEHGNTTTEYYASDDNTVTEKTGIANCGEKEFYRWTEDAVFTSDEDTPPAVATFGSISGDKHYYAIYADVTVPLNPGYQKITSGVTAGTYLIATDRGSSDVAYTGKVDGQSYGGSTSTTVSDGVISTKPATAIEVTITLGTGANASKFDIYDGTYHLGYANKGLSFGGSQSIEWQLDANGYIQHITNTGYTIQYNAANPRFACYNSAQAKAYLYKKQTTTYENFSKTCATFDITIDPGITDGTVTTTPAAGTDVAGEGQEITVNVSPSSCKYLTALSYNDGSDHAISIASTPYTFLMPAADVTVTATFANKSVSSIEANTTTYRTLMQGTSFVGEQIRVTYNNGETEDLAWNDASLTFSGYNMSTLGNQTVNVAYSGSCGNANTSYSIEITDGIPVTFSDCGITTVNKYNPGDVVPVESTNGAYACAGWEFVGWSESSVAASSTSFTPVRNFNASTAKTLYAVYAHIRKDGSSNDMYESADMVADLQEGARYVVAYLANNNTGISAGLTGMLPTVTSTNYLSGTSSFAGTEDKNASNSYVYHSTATIAANAHWQLMSDGTGYWQLYNKTANKYLDLSGHSNGYIAVSNSPVGKLVISNYNESVGDNNSQIRIKYNGCSDPHYVSWNRSSSYFNQYSSGKVFMLTKDEYFSSMPPCAPQSAVFHGNGGTVIAYGGSPTGGDLTIREATRDAGITTPTAEYEDCDGKSWSFIGWADHEVDVTRVPVLTTDLLNDGGGNKAHTITTDGEEFWAVYTNQGPVETLNGTASIAMSDLTSKQYNESESTITKGDVTFGYLYIGHQSDNGIQFKEGDGVFYNKTALGRINKIQFGYFTANTIANVKVYVGHAADAITTEVTSANRQDIGTGISATYTYYPPEDYEYMKIVTSGGYFVVSSIEVEYGKGAKVWATTPDCKRVTLSGDIYATSTNGRGIKAVTPLHVNAFQLDANAGIVISSNSSDVYFSTDRNANFVKATANQPKTSVTVNAGVDGNLSTDIYVHYKPSSDGNGIPADVTVYANLEVPDPGVSASHPIHMRNMPANFVIAVKVGSNWYALPADMSTETNPSGVVIEVDETNMTATAPNTCSYTIWPVKTTNGEYDRYAINTAHYDGNAYGERVRFSAVNNGNKGLWANNSNSGNGISNYAAITSASDGGTTDNTNPAYEWKITTTVADGKWQYTLQTDQTQNDRYLRYWSAASGGPKWGTYSSGETGLYFLPATFYDEAPMQVIEWKSDKIVVMYAGSGTSATTKVGTNSPSSAQALTSKKIDHGVFELTSDQALTNNANKVLEITINDGSDNIVGKKILTVPAIVANEKNTDDLGITTEEAISSDVVVLDGGVLSAVATKYTFKNITVYPGGKLVIGSGKQLGMNSLTLRGGSSWGAASYEYKYPQFVLNNTANGAFSNSAAVINYDYVTTKDQYYSFVLPYNGSTSAIKYPVDIYGSAVSASNTGSFEFQYYDGEARAAGGTGWAVLAEPATLVAGTGYTFLGMPKKVDAYDGSDSEHANTRQRYGIHRIPMSVAAATVQAGEANSDPGKATPISVTLASKNNDSGWNLIGNPYMSNVSGLSNTDIQVGKLVHVNDAGGNWTGRWQWDDTNTTTGVRYIVTTDDGQTFESQQASTATLKAFKNFFVQIQNEEANTLVIPANSRTDKLLAPARYMDEVEQDIQLAVDLVSEARKDKVDLLINDIYTAEFDQDGDFTKMMNSTNFNLYGVYPGDNLSFIAVDKTTAANSIAVGYQVPAGGDYTLQLSDREYVMTDAIEALYVTDHEVSPEVTTDLLDGPYNFHVNNAETNDTRFTISIRLVPKTPTDLEIVPGEGMEDMKPQKFIYHDKMYILRGGVIYDATGKKVGEINK